MRALNSAVVGLLVFGVAVCCGLGEAETASWWSEAERAPGVSLERVLGPGADTAWSQYQWDEAPYHVERDAQLKRDALVCHGPQGMNLTSRTVYGANVEIRCVVRIAPESERGSFWITACKDPSDQDDPGVRITLTASRGGDAEIACTPLTSNRFVHSHPEIAGFSEPKSGRGGFTYDLRSYDLGKYDPTLPTWDPRMRVAIERDMAELPLGDEKWFLIRYEIGQDWIRTWVDGRLIFDHESEGLKTSGVIRLGMDPGVRLAELSVKPLAKSERVYEPIPLDGYVRDRELVEGAAVHADALPFGETVRVDGIPFAFADPALNGGSDHIDVGRSVLRQANMEGHRPFLSQVHRCTDAFTVDPARIRLRIPNGRYDTMYLVAGFDAGENSAPVVSAQFYRGKCSFSMVFEGEVPSVYAREAAVKPLPVRLENGNAVQLWLVEIPLDAGMLSSFADMGWVDIELTKKVQQFRSYPDPIHYGWHGAGLPSGVHIYALTLRRPEVHMEVLPTVFGHSWVAPDVPAYDVRLENRTDGPQEVTLTVETVSDDGEETTRQEKTLSVPAGGVVTPEFEMAVEKNGYHDIAVSMQYGERKWTEKRSFVRLHEDTRDPEWTGEGPIMGYWNGGHYTPSVEKGDEVMRRAGGRMPDNRHPANAWPITPQWDWAGEEPLDEEAYEQYKKEAVKKIRQSQGDNPKLITFFAEPSISRRLTCANYPSYWGDPPYELTEGEERAIRVFFNTAKAAAEGVREEWPDVRILIPWGDPLFVVPLLRAGFPKDLIDGSGLDICHFERLPEQQLHQISDHRIYELREEFRKFGKPDADLVHVEGAAIPSAPGACTWWEQANRHDRWVLICMAYGIKEFYSGRNAFDLGDYGGLGHYSATGAHRRIPYCAPKPDYAHYATMTRMLDRATFEKWLPTGSLSTYCLKFSKPQEKGGPLHVLWTLRGKRPVTLRLKEDGTVKVTDANDNTIALQSENGAVTVATGPSVIYVHGVDEFESIGVGEPDHSDSVEWARERNRRTWDVGPLLRGPEVNYEQTIASLGDGAWSLSEEKGDFEEIFETNNYDTARFWGKMGTSVVDDPERRPALAVKLLKQDKVRKVMPWYRAVEPKDPLVIPGESLAIGLWVKGASDWGRVVYCLRDANDEMWISVGGKDQWNCDDLHSWSSFNFDGWRYVRFELPSHAPYDNFREYGTTWWRYAGGKPEGIGVVDLPLRLEKIIITRRTHILYVNDIQPTHAEENDVLLGDLIAEYESPWHATEEAVAQNRVRMPLPEAPAELANPIARMREEGTLPAVRLLGVRDPDWGYDGTACHVDFEEAEGAKQYQVWAGPYADGRGAVQMRTMSESGQVVGNLAPGVELYLWVTYTVEQGEGEEKVTLQSKPSNALRIQLVDSFGMK